MARADAAEAGFVWSYVAAAEARFVRRLAETAGGVAIEGANGGGADHVAGT
jgi:hypothetical protein